MCMHWQGLVKTAAIIPATAKPMYESLWLLRQLYSYKAAIMKHLGYSANIDQLQARATAYTHTLIRSSNGRGGLNYVITCVCG